MSRFPTFRAAPLTLLTTLLHVSVFATAWAIGGDEAIRKLFSVGGYDRDRVIAGEWWRIITSEFVHRDWEHVLWNCAGLLLLGLYLEPKVGTGQFALLCMVGALASTSATVLFSSRAGGSSGFICALLGAYLIHPFVFGRPWVLLRIIAWLWAARWTFDLLAYGSGSMEIGHQAHAAGFIAGLFVGALTTARAGPKPGVAERTRRLAAAFVIGLGLVAFSATDVQWHLGWHRNVAMRAEHAGDLDVARTHWAIIEELADPRLSTEAVFLENAAKFKLRRHDFVGACVLLRSVAFALDEAKIYRDVGFLMANYQPEDERGRLKAWSQALQRDPSLSEVRDGMAKTLLQTQDTLLYSPENARNLAREAVRNSEMREPGYLHTLAWAEYCCGNTEKAVAWMERALRLGPDDRASYEVDLAEWRAEIKDVSQPDTRKTRLPNSPPPSPSAKATL